MSPAAIGIDIAEISRISGLMENDRFLERFFSESERKYFAGKAYPAESVAANFAGKEAFLKALKKGIGSVPLSEIEILREPSGAPYIRLSGKAKAITEEKNIRQIEISLTHDGGMAAAIVQIVMCAE